MNQRGFIHALLLIILLLGVIVGVYLVSQTQIFKPKADENIPTYATGPFGSTPFDILLQFPKSQSPIRLMVYFSNTNQAEQNLTNLANQFNYVLLNKEENITSLQSSYPNLPFNNLESSASAILLDSFTATQEASLLQNNQSSNLFSFFGHRILISEDIFKSYINSLALVLEKGQTLFFFVQPQLFQTTDPQVSFENNLFLERFYLASFLLFQKPNSTYFGYYPNTPFTTTNGTYFYRDWNLDFGNPISNFSEELGVYKRLYQKGVVVVNSSAISQRFAFPNSDKSYRVWDDLKGSLVKSTAEIGPKQGLFYFTVENASPSATTLLPTFSPTPRASSLIPSSTPQKKVNIASSSALVKIPSPTNLKTPSPSIAAVLPRPTSTPNNGAGSLLNTQNFVKPIQNPQLESFNTLSVPPVVTPSPSPQVPVVSTVIESINKFNQNLEQQVENFLKRINIFN